jgi:NAD(P)-dependent dehydrogenase (short-subunit alcohol dehydrogenase family)
MVQGGTVCLVCVALAAVLTPGFHAAVPHGKTAPPDAANRKEEDRDSPDRTGGGRLRSCPLARWHVKETAVATETEFTGKTALITGAGRGIGRAVALGLGGAAARVVLLARTTAQLEETRALLREQGVPDGRISIVSADLADEQDRGRAARAVLAAGRIDILVNNAATVEPLGPTAAITAADLRLAFEVNVIASAALTAAFLPGMLDAGWGRVVNVSSGIVASPAGMVRGNAYAATKAALEAHTVNLAAELADTGVTVNVYRPGGVDTAMQAWIRDQDPERIGGLHERFNRNYAEGTLITPAHSAAGLLAHLASEDNGAIWDVSTAPAPA